MPKPRGLIDALSSFFTPTDKRKSRVSLSSRTVIPVLARPYAGKKRGRPNGSCKQKDLILPKKAGKSQRAATKLIKKSCQQVNKRDKKVSQRLGRPKGSDQVKSLFDGLSHLYCATGDRRPLPASLFDLPSSPKPSQPPVVPSSPPPQPAVQQQKERRKPGRKPMVRFEQPPVNSEGRRRGREQRAMVAVARPPSSISSVCHHHERRGEQQQPSDARGLRSDVSLRGLKYPPPPLSKLTSSSSSGKQLQCVTAMAAAASNLPPLPPPHPHPSVSFLTLFSLWYSS